MSTNINEMVAAQRGTFVKYAGFAPSSAKMCRRIRARFDGIEAEVELISHPNSSSAAPKALSRYSVYLRIQRFGEPPDGTPNSGRSFDPERERKVRDQPTVTGQNATMIEKTWTMPANELAQKGPLIEAEVGSTTRDKVLHGKALIDTGASRSGVSSFAAQALELQTKGQRDMRGLNDTGFQKRPYYEIKLRLPEMHLNCQLDVVDAGIVGDDDVIFLIGRDILYDLSFNLNYEGPVGSFSLVSKQG